MIHKTKIVIDMTPDGKFRDPPRPPQVPVATRIALWAIVVTVVGAALLIAALAAWIAFLLIPVVVVAGVIAYLAFRFQLWRARASFGRQRPRSSPDIFRP